MSKARRATEKAIHGTHLRREIVAAGCSSGGVLQRAQAAGTYGIARAASRRSALQPKRCVIARAQRVANAAHEGQRCIAAAASGNGNKRMPLRALTSVVHSFGADAAELVQPLGGEVKGRRRG